MRGEEITADLIETTGKKKTIARKILADKF